MNMASHIRRTPRLVAAGLALTALLSISACDRGSTANAPAVPSGKAEQGHTEGEALTLSGEEVERAGVKVEELKAQVIGETLVVTATIRPDADKLARVAPRIEGRITSAPAKLGEHVRAGQALATLDSVEVGESHAAWVQAQSELRIAEADFKRATQLDADEIIPRKEFLRARSDRDKAAAVLRAAADKLRLLGAHPWGPWQRRFFVRGRGTLCGHGDREEGDARPIGEPSRTAVYDRRSD